MTVRTGGTAADGTRPAAIVTGGGSGIGAAVARQLAELGWAVAIAGRRTSLLAEQAEQIGRSGGQAVAITADLASPPDISRLVRETLTGLGRLDAVINNAGIMAIESFEDTSRETFDEVIAVNLRAPYLLTQAALPALQAAPSGAVVNVGSAAASIYRPGQSVYGSSKAAVEYLTKSLAIELADRGIRVNAVVPGPVDTPIHQRPGTDLTAIRATLSRAVPLGRMGSADEVAWWVVQLAAGTHSGWVTGAIVHVDGGRVLVPPDRPL
jgi:NAD(P)-dependent dehydrogenase (short-subunit alcohol dehydrogenase family)